jgi:hypothetical protein
MAARITSEAVAEQRIDDQVRIRRVGVTADPHAVQRVPLVPRRLGCRDVGDHGDVDIDAAVGEFGQAAAGLLHHLQQRCHQRSMTTPGENAT